MPYKNIKFKESKQTLNFYRTFWKTKHLFKANMILNLLIIM